MKLIDIINGSSPSLSFEVFPPKTDAAFDSVMDAVRSIAALRPSYMSVTYGAGGGTSAYTAQIASELAKMGVPSLAHLSCVSSTHTKVHEELDALRALGVENILALRGDMLPYTDPSTLQYHYASELCEEIRAYGGFCIGGACYPECHPDSENSAKDIENLGKKVAAGCEFLTTQMFFDNNILYNFMYRLLRAGIDVPVVAGIMPVTNAKQIKRICAINQSALPQRFIRIIDRYGDNPEAMMQAGIAYATDQIIDLYANGINAVHVYSMNKPEVALRIRENLKGIIS